MLEKNLGKILVMIFGKTFEMILGLILNGFEWLCCERNGGCGCGLGVK